MRLTLWVVALATCGAVLVPLGSCSSKGAPATTAVNLPVLRGYPATQVALPANEDAPSDDVALVTVARAGYLVRKAPLFTEGRVRAVQPIEGMTGAVRVWLNDEGAEALSAFTDDPDHLQQPIALRLGERWVGFPIVTARIRNGSIPLLDLTDNEMALVVSSFPAP